MPGPAQSSIRFRATSTVVELEMKIARAWPTWVMRLPRIVVPFPVQATRGRSVDRESRANCYPRRAAMTDAPDPDRLRAELKDLGYLENPLSRFFVGGLTGKRPAWRTHLRVGVGVGVALGGVLAFLLGLVSLAAPPFPVLSLRDTVVLYAWFCVLGVLGALALGLASGVILFLFFRFTRRFVDKVELAARAAFLAAFAAAFVYLILFWRHYGPPLAQRSGLPSAVVDPLAWLLALLLAMLAGRVMHAAALAVATSIPGFGVARRAGTSKRDRALIGLSLVLALLAPVVFRVSQTHPPEFAEAGAKIERGPALARRVVFVALDGLTRENADEAMARGWMPELKTLAHSGVAFSLVNWRRSVPPAFWTTAVTGLSVERHGIDSFYRDKVVGLSQALDFDPGSPGLGRAAAFLLPALGLSEEVAVTGSMTRVKRVVDVAAEAGLRTASINFWSSWPSEPGRGADVSERAYLELRAAEQAAAKRGGAVALQDARAFAPAELRPRLERALLDAHDLAPVFPEIAAVGLEGSLAVVRPALYDAFAQRTALDVLEHDDPEYLQVCLTGLDILRSAWKKDDSASDSWRTRVTTVVEGYYRFLDRFLGDLRRAAGGDAIVVIASCGGISSPGDEPGLLLVTTIGAGAGAGATGLDPVREPQSIAPTLLFALGLPASEEQDGEIDESWFAREMLEQRRATLRMVPAFGLRPQVEARDVRSSDYLDWLAQLGYLAR